MVRPWKLFTSVNYNFPAAIQINLVQCFNHVLCLIFCYFEEREILHQVYSSDGSTLLLHVAVNQFYDLVGIETVCLSYIQE